MVTSDTGELSTPKFVTTQGKKYSLEELTNSRRYTRVLTGPESPEDTRRLQVERVLDNDHELQERLESDFAQNNKITIEINIPFTRPLKLAHPELNLTREDIVHYINGWKPYAQTQKNELRM